MRELSCYLGEELDTGNYELTNKLVARAESVYKANGRWRHSMNLKGGRDGLYMWMRHWLSGELYKSRPDLSRRIPDDFKRGLKIGP